MLGFAEERIRENGSLEDGRVGHRVARQASHASGRATHRRPRDQAARPLRWCAKMDACHPRPRALAHPPVLPRPRGRSRPRPRYPPSAALRLAGACDPSSVGRAVGQARLKRQTSSAPVEGSRACPGTGRDGRTGTSDDDFGPVAVGPARRVRFVGRRVESAGIRSVCGRPRKDHPRVPPPRNASSGRSAARPRRPPGPARRTHRPR